MNNGDNKNYSALKTLKRLFSISKHYVPWYIALCTAATVRAMLGVVDTESFRQMINGATSSKISMVKYGVLLGFISLILGLILDAFIDYYGEILNYNSTRDLQSKLLRKLTKIKMINYEKYHSGNLIDRLDNCASAAQTGMNTNTRTILEKSLVVIFSSAYLIFLNFRLMVSTLAFIALLPIIVTPLAKILRGLYDKTQSTRVVKDSFVQDSFQGSEIVRTFNLSERLGKTYFGNFNAFVRIIKRILLFEGLMFSTHWIIIFGGDLFILGYGGYLSTKGIVSVGSVISFLLMFEKIMDPISVLSNIWPQFQLSLSSANKVFELLDLPEEDENFNVSQRKSSASLNYDSSIIIDNIHFGYNEDTKILKGTSFICENGKVTALVGPSGGGKSTILKILIKLYEPKSGSILYGNIPLSNIDSLTWRKSTAYVSQDPLLFSGTIMENIKYGSENVSDEAAVEAAKAASIHETIMNTPDGYMSKIGEQGIRLSGGERQRISIARAMLRNPKILILDEPTSALDSENEKLIQEALDALMKGRTTIIVAHRLSTIQNSDKIVFIEDGTVCEEGTHNTLMEMKGKYFDIHEKMKQTVELGAKNEDEEGAI